MPAPRPKPPVTLGRRLTRLLYSRRVMQVLLLGIVAVVVLAVFFRPQLRRVLHKVLPPKPMPAHGAAPADALPFDSPEFQARRALADYLKQSQPGRLQSIQAMNLGPRQLGERIQQQQRVNAPLELANSYLYYLVTFPPRQKEFLPLLLNMTWLLVEGGDATPLPEKIFEQAKLFPAASPAALQLRLIHAEYLRRHDQPQAALELLSQIENQADAPGGVRAAAALSAGVLLDQLGVPQEAVLRFLATGPYLQEAPMQGIEGLGRGAWLALQLGLIPEALDAYAQLRNRPPAAPDAADFTPELKEMIALTADPEAAAAYWQRQRDWWPAWQALAAQLGVAPATDAALGRQLNLAALQSDAQAARQVRSRERYFEAVNRLLEAARWRPGAALTALAMIYQGASLDPAQADALFAFAARLAAALPPDLAAQARQIGNARISALLELGRNEEALQSSAAELAAYGDHPPMGLARWNAMAALRTGRDREAAVARLTQLVESTDPAAAAGRSVNAALLSDLLLALGRTAEARTLLEHEVQSAGQAPESAAMAKAMQEQLGRIQGRDAVAQAFDVGLREWFAARTFPWFAYAAAPEQSAALAGATLPPVVAARAFAVMLDAKVPLPERAAAFNEALNAYPAQPLTGWEVAQASIALARREDVPLSQRQFAYGCALWHLAQSGQKSATAEMLASAPPEILSVADRPSFDLWLDYLTVPMQPEAQQAFADKVFSRPNLKIFDLVLAIRLIENLSRLGAFDVAEALRVRLDGASLDSAAVPRYRAARDHLHSYVDNFRVLSPAYDVLRKLVLETRSDAATVKLPGRWLELNYSDRPDLDLLTLDEARAGLLVTIRERLSYGDHPLTVFHDYAGLLPRDAAGLALRWRIFEAVQGLVERDGDRLRAAQFATLVNFDDPALAARGWAILGASADFSKYPQSSRFIRFYRKLFDWRSGALDGAAAFPGGAARDTDLSQWRFALAFAVQREDRAALAELLDGQPEGALLRVPVLPVYLEALRVLGRDAAAARAAARAEIAAAVVASWWRPSRETAQLVFELARALREPAAYPRAWLDYQLAQMRNDNSSDLMRLADARLRRDWPAVLAAADSFLTRNPTFYDYYWLKAQALVELGRRGEALAPLRLFVRYAHNEPDHPAAVTLLKQLEAEAAAPAPAR